jgi:3-methyladenine DNA glycosylase AlkD
MEFRSTLKDQFIIFFFPKFVMESAIIKSLREKADPKYAIKVTRFFKKEYCDPNSYFIGIQIPKIRATIQSFISDIKLPQIAELLNNDCHEFRIAGLLCLVKIYETPQLSRDTQITKSEIIQFYLQNIDRINNWDLVDLSCHKILGIYLLENHADEIRKFKMIKVDYKNYSIDHLSQIECAFEDLPRWYQELLKSNSIWERRISIVMLLKIIKSELRFCYLILYFHLLFFQKDSNDLLHKAVGWLLRECGKLNQAELILFLESNCERMPKVSLSYACEKLGKSKAASLKNRLKYSKERTRINYNIEIMQ